MGTVDQLKKESQEQIKKLKEEGKEYHNYEQAVKLVLNSIYGAFGNQWFFFFNIDIAESITLQGKDSILYAEKMLNLYFNKYWHKDTEVHDKLGIKVTGKVEKPVGIYIDTDSIASDSIIRTNKGELTVEDLYQRSVDLNMKDMGSTMNGHESINTDVMVLNYTKDKGLYYTPVKRLIKHKVSKKKWKLKTKSGKSIVVTNDHSMMVVRNSNLIKVKPAEIIKTDKIVSIISHKKYYDYEYEEIESIECIGEFENEDVYDIEIDDDSHTFIANDILVHNSTYIKFEEVLEKTEGWEGDEKEFILKLYDIRLRDYVEKVMQKYADNINSGNFLSFELESIAKNAIWLAKKKYMQNIVWKDPDIHYDDLSKISAKGFEIIQSSTPLFARDKLKSLLKYIFSVKKLDMGKFAGLLKDIRREFKLANTDHISFSKKVNNYQKYIVNDHDQFEIAKRCPIGVRSAGYHNYLLNNNPDLKGKYQHLGNGEKLKMYYSTDPSCDVFAYNPGNHPYEFAPPVDYDKQFEKTILDPINRVIVAMGFKAFDRNLIYTVSVF